MTAFRSPRHHPSCQLLMRFASGHLNEAMRLLVASHLDFCPACRQELQSYEAQAGLGLEDLPPEALDISCLENLMLKIDENGPPICIDVTLPPPQPIDERFPESLRAVIGRRGEKIHWHMTASGRHGHVHDMALHFISVPAGGDARHMMQVEHFGARAVALILDGAGLYERGDVVKVTQFAHVPSTPNAELMCLIIVPTRGQSWLDRIMNFLER